MPLTQEKRLDSKFTNNNDQSYLHKKFKKMASTISVYPGNLSIAGDNGYKEAIVSASCSLSISNGSIAAAHPEIEKIKEDKLHLVGQDAVKNVQIKFNDENSRISNVNNIVQVSGQTSFTNEFSNKTENLENDLIKDSSNGGVGGRHICPYCKLSCAKPSVLQKHIRAHTNERPYPCVPCGFAFKTKSNLYKHRRSRTHALRLQGADVSVSLNDDDLSCGSESDTSIPPTSMSETGSDISLVRAENLESNDSTDNSFTTANQHITGDNMVTTVNDNSKSKSIYKPKFRAALYQEKDEKHKLKKSISPNADFLTEHISKIISDNEAIVDVIDTPLQKKYGKIKQIAESKQLADLAEIKSEQSPLNLTKSNNDYESSFRKRSHSESFSQIDHQKHPLNPEGSIIKDLLLKTKINGLGQVTGDLIDGPLFVCPLCQIMYRSADNLETHRMYYCKGNINNNSSQKDFKSLRPENVFLRSNSINVRLPETSPISRANNSNKMSPSRIKPENLIIMKPETTDIVAPLPSPGPLLGNTRLVDTRIPADYIRKSDNLKVKPMVSPKRRIECRSDSYSPRLIENISPRLNEIYGQSKIRCLEANTSALRLDEISQHIKHSSPSLQMFGGEVKIVDHSGSTTTLRIEPSKNQLSPILIQQNLSPSKLANDPEASSIVVRSGLHSGGTMMHNPPTPKEMVGTPQPQTPRITITSANANPNLPNINDITHFQFPPLSAITAFNPLTLPPLSPSSPNGATTILHGGKLIPHVPGMPGPNTPAFAGITSAQPKDIFGNDNNNIRVQSMQDVHGSPLAVSSQSVKGPTFKYDTLQLHSSQSSNLRPHIDLERQGSSPDSISSEMPNYIQTVPVIKIKNVDESNSVQMKTLIRSMLKQDVGIKRNIEGVPRTHIMKENIIYPTNKLKMSKEKVNNINSPKIVDIKSEKDLRNFNYENIITKAEIYNNNQIPSSSEVQKNTNAHDMSTDSIPNERSETSYFQKNIIKKPGSDEMKPKFLRPSTLPLKPGTFTPKRHHGITPNANTMPLVSPETPRPAKAYGQLYLNGNAYTYLGLKCSTKVFYCTINRPQPTYVPNQEFLSMYSNWQLLSELTPDPLGLSASSAMSLYDSRHRPQNVAIAPIKQDLILTHSSQWNTISKECKQNNQLFDTKKSEENKFAISDNVSTPKKELTGGFESNEEYTYVRGRGRGRYVCSECGIRCKKPSMLKKHIRTHTDVRPYTCVHCAFSFKTKGNLTKHMKSKAHYKKCCELGINPNEGNDAEIGEMAQCSGETDDDTDSEGDEGNEGETESSDTEVYRSRLPEHEAAHCLLSLGGTRPTTSATPGLITSARPTTYPYTPTGVENVIVEITQERLTSAKCSPIDTQPISENEPMDLSKNDLKTTTTNIPEIPTARESSVLASLASNTAKTKLSNHQAQWANGEPMLHTYLTERALLDTKIKQSQLTSSLSKVRKVDLEKSSFTDSYSSMDSKNKTTTSIKTSIMTPTTSCQVIYTEAKITDVSDSEKLTMKHSPVSREELPTTSECPPVSVNLINDIKTNSQPSSSAENAKHVVSEYLKHARINLIKSQEDNPQNQNENIDEDSSTNINGNEENVNADEHLSGSETGKRPSLDHDPVARKVVIGAGGVAFKVTKGKDFENSSYSPGRLMEDGRRVCDFCNKTFTKPSQLRLHLNIHYMERPFRCSVCAVSFRTRGHLQKHERSGSHHNKVSMTSTFGAATSFNPRPFRCSDCNIAFRIHGHLAKHLRSKMHVMRLECLFKLPFGTFTEIERAGVSLTDIDTTDCSSSLASLQTLAQKLHEKDPTKLEYREPNGANRATPPDTRDYSDDEDSISCENICESDKDRDQTIEKNEGQDKDTRANYSATDI